MLRQQSSETSEDDVPTFEPVKDVLDIQTDALIGRGAFGTVHYAVLREEQKAVALKVVSKSRTRASAEHGSGVTSSLDEILYGEARVLQELASARHRNMLKFYGWWHDANHVYIAQQLCAGGELPQWLARQPAYTEQVAAKIIYDLLQALTFCHGVGVVHRDVKPQNLLFTSFQPDAYLKLSDWGLATHWREGQPPMSEFCGTLDFTSPEMLDGAYGATTDVWSAGVLLHVLLSGSNPFRGPSKAATEHRVRASEVGASDEEGFAGVSGRAAR